MTVRRVGPLPKLVTRSRRQSGARLPAAFARGDGAMLGETCSGGRGGDVRLKLYLSMVLLAGSRNPHAVHGSNAIVDVFSASFERPHAA